MDKEKANQLRYPLSRIDNDTDHMLITVLEYKPPGLGSSAARPFAFNTGQEVNNSVAAGQQSRIQGTILLPIPDNLSDSNSVQWDSNKMDARDVALLGIGKGILDGADEDGIGGAFGAAGEGIKKAYAGIKNEAVRGAIENYLLGQATNIFTGNVDAGALVSRAQGIALNPNLELLFRGSKLRSFRFPITLTPRSFAEAQSVKGIINTFKKRMAARDSVESGTAAAGIFIAAPSVFEIKFMKGGSPHPFLFKMKTCALTDLQVNYTDGTPYTSYWDGTPVKMSMNLTFTELNPLYSSDYKEEPNSNRGVGF